ncbi:MAG: ABC transporter ATP-binding protein [Clostridia bacterium]|nr:ABC transporter ATP-binding protein [Clostridia bacterium]
MIDVSNLNFTYEQSKKHAVKGLDFHISKGEIFGFLGPNGAGKTTTQRLIIGLLKGYTGKIEIMGKERSKWNKDFFEHIGVAFDFPNLYTKLTGEENLKLISSYYKKQPENLDLLFDKVGLSKDKHTKVESYSKGMKMRLNFIRSIMHDPDIMFFDEPTSGLDPVNAKIIKNMITEMKDNNKTVFLTTHNMTVAEQLCDRVAFINDGCISVIDSPQDLMIENGEAVVNVAYKQGNKLLNSSYPMKGLYENQDFINLLKTDTVVSIHSKEATLEDIFIKLTGRELS